MDFEARPEKRRRLDELQDLNSSHTEEPTGRPISPPTLRRGLKVDEAITAHNLDMRSIPSPIRLSRIRDAPTNDNIDAVRLHDLVGSPLVKECWHFNFLFDVDFVMSAFDEDTRNLVQVKIVHGSWKEEDTNRQRVEAGAAKYKNVQVIRAYMPDPFGTHHSKAMVLFNHGDTCQVIIHTANMIPRDWANLTQGVWLSPELPLLKDTQIGEKGPFEIGTGQRFKEDLLRYFNAYGEAKTGALTTKLRQYDFGSIRAAFVASVPGKQRVAKPNEPSVRTPWGWDGVRSILRMVPCMQQSTDTKPPILVLQVSSIATLGVDDTWLSNFRTALGISKDRQHNFRPPICRIIFPTAEEIRISLDGYDSGNSIHTKIQSPRNQKQLSYLKSMLCHWSGTKDDPEAQVRLAGRRRAAPHIKTYIRFTDNSISRIDWAMITSANLSTQAWGGLAKDGEYKISSWEMGVLIWPELISDCANSDSSHIAMVPTFKKDLPTISEHIDIKGVSIISGFRMPYDLPLVRYENSEVPWCATMDHIEPDWMGKSWTPYGA